MDICCHKIEKQMLKNKKKQMLKNKNFHQESGIALS